MATQIFSDHLKRWELDEHETLQSKILNDAQLRMFETMNTELAMAISEFQVEAAGETGAILNAPNFFILQGRHGLVRQLLQFHDEAMGLLPSSDSSANQSA